MGSKEHSLKTMEFIQPPVPLLQMSALRFRLGALGMLPSFPHCSWPASNALGEKAWKSPETRAGSPTLPSVLRGV